VADSLPPIALPMIRMYHPDLDSSMTYMHVDSYRFEYYAKGWRSTDDPDWDGVPPAEEPVAQSIAELQALIADIVRVDDGDFSLQAGLWLPDGTVVGGVIRRATSVHFLWDYEQTTQPTDIAVGTAIYGKWDALLNDDLNVPGLGLVGPQVQTGYFGPRGWISLEGVHTLGKTQSVLSMGAIFSINTLTMRNPAGVARVMNPGWGYADAPMYVADGAAVTLTYQDTAKGRASFGATPVYYTANGGTMSGVANDIAPHLTLWRPFILGGVTMARSIGHWVKDARDPGPLNTWVTGKMNQVMEDLPNGVNGVTAGWGTINHQIGIYLERLWSGVANSGLYNESTYVDVPLVQNVTGPAVVLDHTAGLTCLMNTSGGAVTLTAPLPVGRDGQRWRLWTMTNPVTLQSEAVLAGSRFLGRTGTRTIAPGDTLDLTYDAIAGAWRETGGRLSQHVPRVWLTHPRSQVIPSGVWTPLAWETSTTDEQGPHIAAVGAATTVAAASNGVALPGAGAAIEVFVANAAVFDAATPATNVRQALVRIGGKDVSISYTGRDLGANKLTGVTGGSGVLATGQTITPARNRFVLPRLQPALIDVSITWAATAVGTSLQMRVRTMVPGFGAFLLRKTERGSTGSNHQPTEVRALVNPGATVDLTVGTIVEVFQNSGAAVDVTVDAAGAATPQLVAYEVASV